MDVTLGRDLTTGRRVAELGELRAGTYLVRVTLVDLGDDLVLGRDVVVTVRETAGVTVLMTRNCVGVVCPAVGDDPTEAACLGGRCVEERCTPETPERCPPPECGVATGCGGMVNECATPVCEDGTCFVAADGAVCTLSGEYCDPRSGCTERPPWAPEEYLKASNTDAGDHFGRSVSLSADGRTLAVGAQSESSGAEGSDGDPSDNSAPSSGAVYVFVRTGDTWVQEAYLKASNASPGDVFGMAVSLSADGNTLAVGASGEASAVVGDEADDGAPGSGAVYVFSRAGGVWSQEAYLKASNPGAGDSFGSALSLSGDGGSLAVGARQEASPATGIDGEQGLDTAIDAGAVYVFAWAEGGWLQEAPHSR